MYSFLWNTICSVLMNYLGCGTFALEPSEDCEWNYSGINGLCIATLGERRQVVKQMVNTVCLANYTLSNWKKRMMSRFYSQQRY